MMDNTTGDHSHFDNLLPAEMAVKSEEIGVSKANMPFVKTFVLSVLAGAFISFGAVFATTVTAGSDLSFGVTRLLGGLVFSLGLVLVIIGGAELFTGNNLVVMAWANKKISTSQLLRNWMIVYAGNFFGASLIAVLVFLSGHYKMGSGTVGINSLGIANSKCSLQFSEAIFLGILCNTLVCLAVWLSFSARSTTGKILAIIFPITAFVACGFEHSVANMYFIPMGKLILDFADPGFLSSINASLYSEISWYNYFVQNLLPVTIGNMLGGSFLVGLVYWFVYLRKKK